MSWQDIVKSVAPVIGTALGGPLGGMATKAISSALFGDDEPLEGSALEKKIAAAVTGDPEALLKIKQADQAFETKMAELGIDLEKIAAEDRQNARNLAINTTLAPQLIIASLFIIGFIAVLYTVFKGDIAMTEQQSNIAMYLLGILSAGIVQIMNFFFGSSAGSKEKTHKLSAVVR